MKWILRLYPPAWRRRYGEEMLALLEQHHGTWWTIIDLIRGALEARLDPHFRTASRPAPAERTLRLQRAHATLFWSFPLLVFGHFLLLDALDDVFDSWSRGHAALRAFKAVSGTITAVGFIALLLIGLLLAFMLATQPTEKPRTMRRVLPLGGLIGAFIVYGIHAFVPSAIGRLFPMAIAASPLPLAFAISRTEIQPRLLCYALAPAALALAGMAAQTLFVAAWGVAIWGVSVQAVLRMAETANRPLFAGSLWHVQLVGGLLWVALMTAFAIWRFGQALRVSAGPER